MMERKEVQSSTVHTIGYDAEAKTLEVTFSSGGTYDYFGVPKEIADSFLNSDSKGHFFQANIRANYVCLRHHVTGCEGQSHPNPSDCKCWCHRLTPSTEPRDKKKEKKLVKAKV